MGELEKEDRHLERQWTLRRERARYEVERARRQYDAVEPENRLVARSLERAWEDKLRAVEAIEQEYVRWRSEGPLVIGAADRAQLQRLGENLPRVWHAATTSTDDRKRLLRLVMRDIVIDAKRLRGQVWLKIGWQTGATSEHRLQRRVHTYRDYVDIEGLRKRIAELNAAGKMDKEIAAILNREGFVAAPGLYLQRRKRLAAANPLGDSNRQAQRYSPNPGRWPDGTFSVQGAAAASGSRRKRCLSILSVDCYPDDSSRKGSHGKSNSRTNRSIDFVLTYDE